MKILVTALTTLVFCGLASGTANTIIPASSSETIPTPIRSIPIPTSVSVPPQTQPVAAIADKPLITPTSSTSSTPSTSSTSSTSLTPSTTSTTPTSSTTSPTTIPNTSLPPSFGENTRYSIYDTPAGSGIVISNTIDNDKLKPLDISKLSELMKSISKKLDLPEDAVEKSIAAYLETLSVMADAAVYVREHVGTPQFYGEQPAESDFSSSNPSSVPTSAFTLSPSPSRDNYYYYPMRMVDSSNRNVFNIAALSSQHAEQLLFNTLSNAIGLRPTSDNYVGKIIDAHSDENIPSPNANPNLQAQPRLMTTASMNADPYYPPFDQPYLFRYPRSIRLGGLRPIDMASIINNSRATPPTPTPTTAVASTVAPTAVPSTSTAPGTSTTDTTSDTTSVPDVTNTGNNTADINTNNISTPTPNTDSSTSLTPLPSGPDAPPLTAEDLLSFSNPILIDSYDPSNPSRMNVHPRGLYPEFYSDYIAAAIAANKEKEARANAANAANPANAENTENRENATNGGNAATTATTAITATTDTPSTTATSTTNAANGANENTAEDAEKNPKNTENPEDDDHNDCDENDKDEENDKNEKNDDNNDSDDSDDDSDSDCESNNNNRFERRSNERPFGSTMSTRRVFTLRNTYPALSRYSNPLTYTGPDGVLREVPVGSAGCQTLNCVIKCSGPAYLNNKAYCEKALSDTSRSMYTDAFGGVVSPVVPRPRRR